MATPLTYEQMTPRQRDAADLQREVYGRLYAYCDKCGAPLRPCPKGPGADEPGYCGFYPCCERAGVTYLR